MPKPHFANQPRMSSGVIFESASATGEDSYSSYAYPGEGNAAQLTSVVVPPTPQ